MPELPEVETTRRGIKPHVSGQKINACVVREARLRWPVPSELPKELPGQRIHSVERRAKYLLLVCDDGTLMIHLGMSGTLRIVPKGAEPDKHDHVDIELASGQSLRFRDPRRFGSIHWLTAEPSQHPLLIKLGPEPLADDFDERYLHRRAKGKQQAVKTFIMDSQVVVGVGNIYANEALFMAGIDPRRPAGRISLARYERLVQAIKEVLAAAIKKGGTTLKDFVGGDGKQGYFSLELQVYGRGGEACVQCGRALKEIRLGQRSTVYCSHCQS